MKRLTGRRLFMTIITLSLAACGGGSSREDGDAPPENGNGPAPAPWVVGLAEAFPSLVFSQPVALLQRPGDDDWWYLLEQAGRILMFDNSPGVAETTVFADLRDPVNSDANSGESGLLAMAFHPDFARNGEVFIYYQVSESGSNDCCLSQLVRYVSDDGGETLNENSAEVLLELTAPYNFKNHFGGELKFDALGFLYLSIGDGGSGGDPDNRAQNTANLWGSVVRLDVDAGSPYAIPADNPFADEADLLCDGDQQMLDKEAAEGNCPELYAWGLRNPWRWSFDRATGDLWLADVGQNQQGWLLRFVTNTATKSRAQILDKLLGLGFTVESQELFTAPDAALGYVRARGMTPYALVHPAIEPVFGPAPETPDCVVLGDARDGLSYANLNRAFRLVQRGCPLIAIGDNKYFREGDVLSLDAGPFVRAIAWAADAEPVVMGKPSAAFFTEVVNSTGLTPEACLMVGDDVYGDVDGALRAGLDARLVKTGKYQPGDERRLSPPAQTLNSIADLEPLL